LTRYIKKQRFMTFLAFVRTYFEIVFSKPGQETGLGMCSFSILITDKSH
jgi:hypothetical protein